MSRTIKEKAGNFLLILQPGETFATHASSQPSARAKMTARIIRNQTGISFLPFLS